jgi:hypothetical protein
MRKTPKRTKQKPLANHSKTSSDERSAQKIVVDESIQLARKSNLLQLYSLYVSIFSLIITIVLTILIFNWTTKRETAQLEMLGSVDYDEAADLWNLRIFLLNDGPAQAQDIGISILYQNASGGLVLDKESLKVCCPNSKPDISFYENINTFKISPQKLNVGESQTIYANFRVAEPLKTQLLEYINTNKEKLTIWDGTENKWLLGKFIFQIAFDGPNLQVRLTNLPVVLPFTP